MFSNTYLTCFCIFPLFCCCCFVLLWLTHFGSLFMFQGFYITFYGKTTKIMKGFPSPGQSKFCCCFSSHMFSVPGALGHMLVTKWPLAIYFHSSCQVCRLSEQCEDSWKTFFHQDSRKNLIIHWSNFQPHMTIWNCQCSIIFDLQKWQFHMSHTNISH